MSESSRTAEATITLSLQKLKLLLHLTEMGLRTADRQLFIPGGVLLQEVHEQLSEVQGK